MRGLTARGATPWAEVDGLLGIGKDAPFQVQGRFTAQRREPTPLGATLDVSGRLAAIAFQADARAQGMYFMATGAVAPFARIRLPKLLVAGQGIDPRQFSTDAPRADLAFSGIFQGQPGERLLGTFSLSNRLAGRFDLQRPLANLTGVVVGDSEVADFSALSIDLGAAGQFVGDGQWRDGRLLLKLASEGLNLAGLHRDLHPTRIRTSLQLSGDADRQALVADVSETWGAGRFTLVSQGSRRSDRAPDRSPAEREPVASGTGRRLRRLLAHPEGRRVALLIHEVFRPPEGFGRDETCRQIH